MCITVIIFFQHGVYRCRFFAFVEHYLHYKFTVVCSAISVFTYIVYTTSIYWTRLGQSSQFTAFNTSIIYFQYSFSPPFICFIISSSREEDR